MSERKKSAAERREEEAVEAAAFLAPFVDAARNGDRAARSDLEETLAIAARELADAGEYPPEELAAAVTAIAGMEGIAPPAETLAALPTGKARH